MQQQTEVRVYKTRGQMRRGIAHETRAGWRVVGTTYEGPTCLRRLMWGLIFARGRYLVTFAR